MLLNKWKDGKAGHAKAMAAALANAAAYVGAFCIVVLLALHYASGR